MNEHEPQSNPEQVDHHLAQIGKNGLSQDYINEISALYSAINSFGIDEAIKFYEEFGIKKYKERYNQENITIQDNANPELIKELDQKVEELRQLFSDRTITVEEFNRLYQEINHIVRSS